MLRQLHSLPGLVATLLLIVITITGALLALDPARERLGSTIPARGEMSVADLTARLAQHYSGVPGVEQIQRTPSGAIIVYFSSDDGSGADVIDPRTGQALAPYEKSAFMRGVKNLHRSLFLDIEGRIATGSGAAIMLLLIITGLLMLAARSGGWRGLFGPIRGSNAQRLHGVLARYALLGLLLSSLTGLYLSAGSLGLIPETSEAEPEFPPEEPLAAPLPTHTLAALKTIDLNDLRELVYPYPGDLADYYSVRTHQGTGFVHASSGEMVVFEPHSSARKLYEFIYMLHTGEGLWWLGLLLGLSALNVPVLAFTGTQIWWKRRSGQPTLTNNVPASTADTVILVGSEGNTTWGFARTLHDALTRAGQRVHTAPMNALASGYPAAKYLLILAATYGDGGPPVSGNQFLARLPRFRFAPEQRFAVLGFGDRQFTHFCQFALDVDAVLRASGGTPLCPLDLIDRQSPQEFARWGRVLGEAMGTPLQLEHIPARPQTTSLQLVEREEYGADTDTPTTVFRFAVAQHNTTGGVLKRWFKRGLPHFEAGDLLGILPPGSHVPRFYSLASASKEGIAEICVRKHKDGLCSSYLHGLKPGDCIDAFIRPNPAFRPASGKNPVILVCAGTGIGPLVGFVKHNTSRRPMYLYWGGRNPQSDFLYQHALQDYLKDRRLTKLNAAFSRTRDRAYVQDKLRADGAELQRLIQDGAQILVCGGQDMAKGVREVIDGIVAPLNTSIQTLKAEGRYREDVY